MASPPIPQGSLPRLLPVSAQDPPRILCEFLMHHSSQRLHCPGHLTGFPQRCSWEFAPNLPSNYRGGTHIPPKTLHDLPDQIAKDCSEEMANMSFGLCTISPRSPQETFTHTRECSGDLPKSPRRLCMEGTGPALTRAVALSSRRILQSVFNASPGNMP